MLLFFVVLFAPLVFALTCGVDSDCPQMGPRKMVCSFPAGTCPLNQPQLKFGVCVPQPTTCTKELHLVCGCDFITYPNPCKALSNGTSVLHFGACNGNNERCNSDSDCLNENHFCRTHVGLCSPDGMWAGVCASPPVTCSNETAQNVCSCSGNDFDTPCAAYANRESIDYLGLCKTNQTCYNDRDCKDFTFYCRYNDGQCTPVGICTLKPEVCTMEYAPVCTCDGYTIGNRCSAEGQGKNIWKSGPCKE